VDLIVESGRRSISDYAGPKRIRNIFQRATTRFRDIGIWLQYIDYSKSQRSPKLTSKLFGESFAVLGNTLISRALQTFPNSAELWIMAAHYEYENNLNISGARNLLLRSIRLNPEKQELWFKLAELECVNILKITERRRILGLDTTADNVVEDTSELEGNEIQLPTITEEELQKTDGPQLDPLLTSPLTDAAINPALNGAVPLAVYSSAIASRPDDISLSAGFYDVFLPFCLTLSFIDSALNTVKSHMEEKFSRRGLTLSIQIRDHARGIHITSKNFPSALREMMKMADGIPSLPLRERKECCATLMTYLDGLSAMDGLDVNLKQVVKVFKGRVGQFSVKES